MKLRLVVVGVAAVAAVAVVGAGALAVTGSNTISTVAGTGESGFSGDGGPATSAQIYRPAGLAFDAQGNMYIADLQNDRIRKVTPAGTITTFAGGGSIPGPGIGDGGPATSAELFVPESVAVDAAGNVYIADRNNQRIRMVNTAGTITTFAGGGAPVPPDIGDGGPATSARLAAPAGVTVDTQGNVYIGDRDHMRVRKVDTSGTITTYAGDGTQGSGGDGGPATSAQLRFPHKLAIDAQGNLYIADRNNHRVRKVDSGGTITTIAGTGVICSPNFVCGDGGPATSATLQQPVDVALDAQGSLYIVMADRVRKADSAGIITTIATLHSPGPYPGDGLPAIVAKILGPTRSQSTARAASTSPSTTAPRAQGRRGLAIGRDDRVRGARGEGLRRPRLHGQRDGEHRAAGQLQRQRQLHDQRHAGAHHRRRQLHDRRLPAGRREQPASHERQPHVRDREGEPDDHVRGAREQEARRSRLHAQRARDLRGLRSRSPPAAAAPSPAAPAST